MLLLLCRYTHGSYLKKHSVSHSLALAQQFLEEADKLMAQERVGEWFWMTTALYIIQSCLLRAWRCNTNKATHLTLALLFIAESE